MASNCRKVILPRGSPAPCHSGTGAGASSFSTPSSTSRPISVPAMLLLADQPSSSLLRSKPGAYCSATIRPPCTTTIARVSGYPSLFCSTKAWLTALSSTALSTFGPAPFGWASPSGQGFEDCDVSGARPADWRSSVSRPVLPVSRVQPTAGRYSAVRVTAPGADAVTVRSLRSTARVTAFVKGASAWTSSRSTSASARPVTKMPAQAICADTAVPRSAGPEIAAGTGSAKAGAESSNARPARPVPEMCRIMRYSFVVVSRPPGLELDSKTSDFPIHVIPAKAEIPLPSCGDKGRSGIPAFAGMTGEDALKALQL